MSFQEKKKPLVVRHNEPENSEQDIQHFSCPYFAYSNPGKIEKTESESDDTILSQHLDIVEKSINMNSNEER